MTDTKFVIYTFLISAFWFYFLYAFISIEKPEYYYRGAGIWLLVFASWVENGLTDGDKNITKKNILAFIGFIITLGLIFYFIKEFERIMGNHYFKSIILVISGALWFYQINSAWLKNKNPPNASS